MSLGFIGIDPNTGGGGSPTVWVKDETEEIFVQSLTIDEVDREEIAGTTWVPGHVAGIPAHESVIRIPGRMVPILREACDAVERARLRHAAEERSEDSSPSGDA